MSIKNRVPQINLSVSANMLLLKSKKKTPFTKVVKGVVDQSDQLTLVQDESLLSASKSN
jgi:hypothetical protein